MVRSCDLADHSNTGHHQLDFSVRFSDHLSNTGPFDNWTQIIHSNTRLVWSSDGYCIAVFECHQKTESRTIGKPTEMATILNGQFSNHWDYYSYNPMETYLDFECLVIWSLIEYCFQLERKYNFLPFQQTRAQIRFFRWSTYERRKLLTF